MNLLSQPDEVKATFAIWQALRTFGFPSDDLFVGVVEGRVLIEVRRPERAFRVAVGSTSMPHERFAGALPRKEKLSQSARRLT